MAKSEIEFKFLVDKKEFLNDPNIEKYLHSRQGYFHVTEEAVSSFRIALIDYAATGEQVSIINMKGNRTGASRAEIETKIPRSIGEDMFAMANHSIEKDRYHVKANGSVPDLMWEVDVYYGENFPLVVAELEVPSEDVTFEKPEWILKNVTDDDRFYNANLSEVPVSEFLEEYFAML